MKNVSIAACSAYVALLAFGIVCIDNLLKSKMPIGSEIGFTYISFVAWAVYSYFFNSNKENAQSTCSK